MFVCVWGGGGGRGVPNSNRLASQCLLPLLRVVKSKYVQAQIPLVQADAEVSSSTHGGVLQSTAVGVNSSM